MCVYLHEKWQREPPKLYALAWLEADAINWEIFIRHIYTMGIL